LLKLLEQKRLNPILAFKVSQAIIRKKQLLYYK
jgi:hypothetical protein